MRCILLASVAVLAIGLVSTDEAMAERVIQSVTGNGHVVGGAVDRTVTFSIHKRADGTVDGWYHSEARGPGGASIKVRIECLHVVGNQAWAAGTVVSAVSPDNIGRPYSLRFVDNGEGGGASPDEIGGARFEYHDCQDQMEFPLRQLTMGNLRIRG
jgi:hypothetical protein